MFSTSHVTRSDFAVTVLLRAVSGCVAVGGSCAANVVVCASRFRD